MAIPVEGVTDEYSTLVFNISLPGSRQLSITITPRLLKVVIEVWYLFK